MNYHVLSNQDIGGIIAVSLCIGIWLSFKFAKLGRRDPSPTYEKGLIGEIVPWVILLIFVSEVALLHSCLREYPWDIEAQPSAASAYREMMYFPSSYPGPMYGWANDDQLKIVGRIGKCVCALCWTCYAFAFERSDTNWWKKIFKVIAYILLSVLIVGFSLHEIRDFLVYSIFLVPAFILLHFARVKKKESSIEMSKQDTNASEEEKVESKIEEIEERHEDETRFMPTEVLTETKDSVFLSDEIDEKPELVASSASIVEEEKEVTSETMFCKHCGKQIESDSAFCKYCGKEP